MKRKRSKFSMFGLAVILGFLIAIQFQILESGYKYVLIQDLDYLGTEVEKVNAEIELIKAQIAEREERIISLGAFDEDGGFSSSGKTLEEKLKSDIRTAKEIAGLTDVRGPGVIVIISDGERDLLEYEDPNNVLVHDMDVRNIVDDLRNAGAEAISLNGQRVIFGKTKIFCHGPTIKVNDQVFAQPFIIKAIGDRNYLESAINAPGQYGNILRQYGLFVEVNTSMSLTVPGYEGRIDFSELKPVEEASN